MIAVIVPHESVNDESVMLLSWLVPDGHCVEPGQALAEVEGSKATFQIPSPAAGVVTFVRQVGEEVPVGEAICRIAALDSPGMPACTGQARQEPSLELQQRATLSIPLAPVDVLSIHSLPPAAPDDGPDAGANGRSAAGEGAPPDEGAPPTGDPSPVRYSRHAREMMELHHLDPASFRGWGLVRAADVLALVGRPAREATALDDADGSGLGEGRQSTTASVASPALKHPDDVDTPNAVTPPARVEAISRTKRTEIRYLRSAHRNVLPSSVSVSVPTRGLRRAAANHPVLRESPGALVVFEAARLLVHFPFFNGYYSNGAAHLYQEVNVGFAIDAGQGLKAPVVRHADRKPMSEIALEMRDHLVGYLNSDIPLRAMTGGTFTVTDLSAEGASGFVPLINERQAAILGVGAEVFLPDARQGAFSLTLTFDHQMSEGRAAARFLNDLAARLSAHEIALRGCVREGPAAGGSFRRDEQPHCGECLMSVSQLEKIGGTLLQKVNADGSAGLICSKCLAGF